jgi:hypothetical protein
VNRICSGATFPNCSELELDACQLGPAIKNRQNGSLPRSDMNIAKSVHETTRSRELRLCEGDQAVKTRKPKTKQSIPKRKTSRKGLPKGTLGEVPARRQMRDRFLPRAGQSRQLLEAFDHLPGVRYL